MTRRIALTLGMGVAIMSLAARPAHTLTVTETAASIVQVVFTGSANPGTLQGRHHSGYIVASS
jgi:hypothetical protein